MKTILKAILVAVFALVFQINPANAQKGGKHKHHHKHKGDKTVVVVKNHPHHKHYRRKVYHPVWAPSYAYHRRWVYFPHYNFYWDNYSSMYVYWGNGMWIRTASPPPVIINVNISKAKKYELKEDDDYIDDIYGSNALHVKLYPDD